MIRIRATTIETSGGGQFWQPKTRTYRAVPISRALREYLDKYIVRPSDHGWFFPSPQATWWDPDNFSSDLRKANQDAGLPWSSLDYRHTFGSQLAQRNVSLYKIATLMGNSPEICRRHYAAFVPDAMNKEVDFHPNSAVSRAS